MNRFTLQIATEGATEIINLSAELARHSGALQGDGLLHLFAVGSTVALTTLEYEPGLVKVDVREMLQR